MATMPSRYFLMVAATFLKEGSLDRLAQLIHSSSFCLTTLTWRRPRMSQMAILSR